MLNLNNLKLIDLKSYYELFDALGKYYNYVPINWLIKFNDFIKENKIKFEIPVNYLKNNTIEDNDRLNYLLYIYNSSLDAINFLLENKDDKKHSPTYEYMKKMNFSFQKNSQYVERNFKSTENLTCYSIPGEGGKDIAFKRDFIKKRLSFSRDLVSKLKSRRERDLCIIVGNGPSLKKINIDLLKGEDVFISNNAFLDTKLKKISKYFAVTNFLVAEQGKFEINQLKMYKFFPYWLSYTILEDDMTCFLNADLKREFSIDVGERISWMSTVSYFMLQIAYSLGYKKIVMIGFDNSYKQKPGVKEGDIIISDEDDENHFDKSYFKGKKWQAADTDHMNEVYKISKTAFENDEREIFNASIGGKLEVFKRDSLENALNR
ncbi:hypothetical protein [uncultured Desulfosarcina sp.]|uniref:hypothetical protein n=1 Tax=uncultured Desulfosarcina sp. TaxID=218289 RepID=UPI0029C64481|nr:hypothetical protein [uncultured Desulfosarcina sp.]